MPQCDGSFRCGRPGWQALELRAVEIVFTTLLVLAIVAVTWFAAYVVYRLYADQG